MNDNMNTIGLFPINAVLFPAARLPLHVFEERYKQLIGACVADEEEFGVNLMDSRKVHDVGCSARVADVVTRYKDGRLDIVIEGMRRYRVGELDVQSKPYLVTTVQWLEDTEIEVDGGLLFRTAGLYNEIVQTVYGGTVEPLHEDALTGDVSFKIAQKAGLELQQRQELLAINNENLRLQYLETYLSELLPKIREAERIQGIIRNDGYL